MVRRGHHALIVARSGDWRSLCHREPEAPVILRPAGRRIGRNADLVVHTWDFARATGQDQRLDPDAVRAAHAWLQTLGDGIRRPGGFAAPIEPPQGADEQTAFLCYTGRRV